MSADVLEVDLEEAQTRAEDAKLQIETFVPYRERACLGLVARDVSELAAFLLVVAPQLDDRFETVGDDLDFHPAWQGVQQADCRVDDRLVYYWPKVHLVRDLNRDRGR